MASKIKDKLEQTRRKLAQTFQVQEIERLSALAKQRRTTSRNTGKTPPANRTPPGNRPRKSKRQRQAGGGRRCRHGHRGRRVRVRAAQSKAVTARAKTGSRSARGQFRARAFETLGSRIRPLRSLARLVLSVATYCSTWAAIQSGVADRVAQAIDASIATLTRGRACGCAGQPCLNAIEGWRAYREGVRDA